jgi:hypothetical protein
MLSKNELDLLYASVAMGGRLSFLFSPFVAASIAPFIIPSSPGSAIGDPDAIASFIISSLLNLAFADSKS